MAEVKGVAVGLDREGIADHDDDQDKDKAVLGPSNCWFCGRSTERNG
jgi:hypothetical protein